jgi:hypothetical protein
MDKDQEAGSSECTNAAGIRIITPNLNGALHASLPDHPGSDRTCTGPLSCVRIDAFGRRSTAKPIGARTTFVSSVRIDHATTDRDIDCTPQI